MLSTLDREAAAASVSFWDGVSLCSPPFPGTHRTPPSWRSQNYASPCLCREAPFFSQQELVQRRNCWSRHLWAFSHGWDVHANHPMSILEAPRSPVFWCILQFPSCSCSCSSSSSSSACVCLSVCPEVSLTDIVYRTGAFLARYWTITIMSGYFLSQQGCQ